MTNKPSIAVVILNWNGKSFLEKFLPAVMAYSEEADVIVADNQSDDDSVSFVTEKFSNVKIVQNDQNFGFAKGYNEALKKINADYYILLNSDVEVTPGWINPIMDLMAKDPTIAACQPKILDYKTRDTFEYAGASGGFIDKYCYPFCRGRVFNHLEKDHQQYDSISEVFWATGACMFVKAEAFWEAGGFDDDFFAHMEEIDLCWRLKNIGYKIFVQPQSVVYHVGGGTLNKISPRKTFLNFRNNLITYTKNHAEQYLFLKIFYRMILDGVAAFKFLLEGNGQHFIAVIKAHFAFYGSLRKTLKKRRHIRQHPKYQPTTTCIYKRNIVYAYYIKGIKSFSDLMF